MYDMYEMRGQKTFFVASLYIYVDIE